MSSPSLSEVQGQIDDVVLLLESIRNFGHVNTPNFIALEDALLQSVEGDFSSQVLAGLEACRGSINEAMLRGESMLSPLLATMGKVLDVPERDAQGVLTRLYDYMATNSLSIKTRAFSFGTIAVGGSNVGTGTVNRLNKDAENYDREAQHADIKTIECVGDEHSGAFEHEEVFTIRGGAPLKDFIQIVGSGKSGLLTAVSARASLIGNPSFSRYGGTYTVLTEITDWTVGSALTNFNLITTDYYRDYPGDTTPLSLRFLANDSISQNLNVRSIRLDPSRPYYLQVAFKREASCDGNLTLSIGSVDETVALSAQSGWTILRIPLTQKCWFDYFNEENLSVVIALTSRTTGTLLVDEVILVPFEEFDGSYYCVVGGATPFLRDDVFTFTDTETGSIFQRWLWRIYGRYLPHDGSPTWADPT